MTSANLPIDVPVVIADKPLTFRFSTMAVAALGKIWGCNGVDEVFEKLSKVQSTGKIDLDDGSILIWAALQKHHPDISIEAVRELLDDNGLGKLQPVIEKLSDAIQASMPSPKGAAANGRPTPKRRK